MTDAVPNDVPLDEQDEGRDDDVGPSPGDLDERGESLDERGEGPGVTPANPISEDAGITSDG
jgi:hypothetical protein